MRMRGLVLLAVAVLAHGQPTAPPPSASIALSSPDRIVHLTSDTLYSALYQHSPLLVSFVAPWCSHCKTLMSELAFVPSQVAELAGSLLRASADDPAMSANEDAAASDFRAALERYRVAVVDATEEPALSSHFGVRSYPSISMLVLSSPPYYSSSSSSSSFAASSSSSTSSSSSAAAAATEPPPAPSKFRTVQYTGRRDAASLAAYVVAWFKGPVARFSGVTASSDASQFVSEALQQSSSRPPPLVLVLHCARDKSSSAPSPGGLGEDDERVFEAAAAGLHPDDAATFLAVESAGGECAVGTVVVPAGRVALLTPSYSAASGATWSSGEGGASPPYSVEVLPALGLAPTSDSQNIDPSPLLSYVRGVVAPPFETYTPASAAAIFGRRPPASSSSSPDAPPSAARDASTFVLLFHYDEHGEDGGGEAQKPRVNTANDEYIQGVIAAASLAARASTSSEAHCSSSSSASVSSSSTSPYSSSFSAPSPGLLSTVTFVLIPSYESRVWRYFGMSKLGVQTPGREGSSSSSSFPEYAVSPGDARALILDGRGSSGLRKYYASDSLLASGHAGLLDFLHSWSCGSLKPLMKSLPPDPSDPPATSSPPSSPTPLSLKGYNFSDVVSRVPGPSLVAFHAPWCGHCKRALLALSDCAAKLHERGGEGGVFLVDATTNEVDWEGVAVESFPTVYFFGKRREGRTKTPRLYTRSRFDAQDLMVFMDEMEVAEEREEAAGRHEEL